MRSYFSNVILLKMCFVIGTFSATLEATEPLAPYNTTSAAVTPAEGTNFSIDADFLYWQARVGGLDFAESNILTPVTGQGSIYYPKFEYRPGFKVGFAFDLGHDFWDIAVDYVRLNGTGGKNSVSDPSPSETIATRRIFEFAGLAKMNYVDGNFGLIYNLLNCEIGRDYFFSKNLNFRPFFGLSGAWNRISSLVNYFSVDTYFNQNYSQRYVGIGYRAGLNSGWHFNKNFCIFGDLTLMNLWSRYQVYAKETVTTDPVPVVNYDTKGIMYGVQFAIDIQMGFRWSMRYDHDTKGISLQAGWDEQVWINHVQHPVATYTGNLSFQGLDIKARLDF